MKEGALIGAIVGALVFFMLPIYSEEGTRASILPTGNVVSKDIAFQNYIGNIPFSMIVFFTLEILGICLGAIGQIILKRNIRQD